jgi:chromosome segregation ATPase
VAFDNSQSGEIDLDRTDRLPILDGAVFDHDVADDAVRLEYTTPHLEYTAPQPAVALKGQAPHSDFARPMPVDLPSLAESVRSVEERIARQHAEYEALARSYEKVHESEAAAVARANTASADLAAAHAALAAEQQRTHDLNRALAEKSAAAEAARTRAEEALRETERSHSESRTLRESLAAREASIVQILNSLRERDAQLGDLQREHAKIVPELETRSQSNVQLAAELKTSQSRGAALAHELQAARASMSSLTTKTERSASELASLRSELSAVKSQAAVYLEQLRSREWRLGFNTNIFRELDAEVGAVRAGRDSLQDERDRLRRQLVNAESKLSIRDATIAELQGTLASNVAAHNAATQEVAQHERQRAELTATIATLAAQATRSRGELESEVARLRGELESEATRLRGELDARDRAVVAAQMAGSADVLRLEGLIRESEKKQAELLMSVAQLQTEAQERDQEMTVLIAHLQEARRPVQSIEAEVKRLTEELASKTAAFDQLTEDARQLRTALERTRGALEEREFLIRRLERSESNNAAVLGRLQTSIERLGTPPTLSRAVGSPAAEPAAEFVRVDGSHQFRHPLGRRTRIGRAQGCDLQIDSSSVSRHHALILLGPHEAIIEDLNSTNGVLVNGRKISRQPLRDGDLVLIGDVKFRFALKPPLQLRQQDPPERPAAG